MIRLPSIQNDYDEFWSGDDAFVQLERGDLDDDAWAKLQEAHAKKVERARETGDWSELLIEGQTPTKFVLHPIAGDLYRRIVDDALSDKIGLAELNVLCFRAALVRTTLDGKEVKHVQHPRYGKLATADIPNLLDRVDKAIVNEIGRAIREKAQGLSPKS